ncbi:hypothetical protein TRV_04146 [Trichophyton verrucosum HKI 0517]|uniref:Uncharacterized protein n=1 Tax=Trichophyton verrucosum (strain HKI 0517) TaxID=663202 RepID=D4DAJ9_TRIVH|nr:uncharacterized protein TRV_04146 [Trichophyton verrucosum HKI 0517]EFE41130.1 hypothetical protein TRV_04146 [Trichophyton verrucosum HKI 0517]
MEMKSKSKRMNEARRGEQRDYWRDGGWRLIDANGDGNGDGDGDGEMEGWRDGEKEVWRRQRRLAVEVASLFLLSILSILSIVLSCPIS